jgi:ABC-type multidrug transport system ATPase subunit
MNVIEVSGLRKEYRKLRGRNTLAVNGLDLEVEEGGVFGFLGPNGSGKTTTIRCLLGLVKPTEGECRIFGKDCATELHQVLDSIGSIVEAPALFPSFSGRRNLDLLARMRDIPRSRIDEVLEITDLKDRGKDLVKNYSLGMKQRLAIGAALLKDPKLLILDEPANGLDPSGIREVRQLLRRLGDEGRSVFVSSHILSEVQHTADRLAILSHGRCVITGSVDEVITMGHKAALLVRVTDGARAVEVLEAAGLSATAGDEGIVVEIDPAEGARVSEILARHMLYPIELRPLEVDLETVFLELTESEAAA